ncbi:MAG: 3-deoxy-D-manno-octulosonic acid transferase [Alphaproteobacteria bacterium]|nr:3-deoxy-D-manno-octulosonic acid transferase [Alphaproteobacteria bacterium]
MITKEKKTNKDADMFLKIYNALITILYPLVIKGYINKRKQIGKEDVARFNERVGRPKLPRPEGKLFWLHGASVGESVSMLPLINKILETYPDSHVMVTTGTVTSADVMQKRLPERAFHQFIPIDNPIFTTRFVRYWHPDVALWFESEFWPAVLTSIRRKNIPLILINGRISNKTFKRWQQFDFVCKELLSCFTMCLGQSEEDAYRLRVLGAKETACLGNLKYAGLPLPIDENNKKEMLKQIGDRKLWLASSTHDDEEIRLAKVHKRLKEKYSDLLTIIVPRHPNRGQEVADEIKKLELSTALRSKGEKLNKTTDIYIADTIGEVGLWYDIAKIVFIGGSLIPHGGQNFIEPSRVRDAVIVGPHMHNFTDAMSRAKKADAVMQISDTLELQELLEQLLDNEQLLDAKCSLAYNWAASETKVLDGIMDKIKAYF